jgi:hypothetical protein
MTVTGLNLDSVASPKINLTQVQIISDALNAFNKVDYPLEVMMETLK